MRVSAAAAAFGLRFALFVGLKNSRMSVCRCVVLSALLNVFFAFLNRCALKRFIAFFLSGLGRFCRSRVLRLALVVVVAVSGSCVHFSFSLSTSLSHAFTSLAIFSNAVQSPLIGASMHKSPTCGAL